MPDIGGGRSHWFYTLDGVMSGSDDKSKRDGTLPLASIEARIYLLVVIAAHTLIETNAFFLYFNSRFSVLNLNQFSQNKAFCTA